MREREAWAAGRVLVGIDEAGRGPIAGPVVAAAVCFSPDRDPPAGLRDSKTLSAAQRAAALVAIRADALAVGIGAASVREIDALNIRRATALAMRRAADRVRAALAPRPHRLLLDGTPMPDLGLDHEALVDGDALCVSISAAGIVAKEVRDALMRRLAVRHPAYGWAANAGYGTAAHLAALRAQGATRHHRTSFGPVTQLDAFR